MPSTQEFRRRIKSVNNTKQITKAMQMIASIKMQKATRFANAARSYTQNAWNMLLKLAKLTLPQNHPLISPREVKKVAVILITSDRGLCGAYNSELIKKYIQFTKSTVILSEAGSSAKSKDPATALAPDKISPTSTRGRNDNMDVIAVGKKGAEYIRRYGTGNLVAEFPGFENEIEVANILPLSKLTSDEYLAGKYDRVFVIYSHFESSLKQIPVAKQILPIVSNHIDKPELWERDPSVILSTFDKLSVNSAKNPRDPSAEPQDDNGRYRFERSDHADFEGTLQQFLKVQIYCAVLEANASEHSARMFAMQNATDNASDLISELQLVYNTVRQGNITREIAEISGAAEAMK